MLPKDDVEPSETFDWLGMLLLSPGLAAFLFGVSSIPEEGTAMAPKVLVPMILGAVLIAAFVPWALAKRNIHPLVELRLFKNRNLTVAIIAMTLFAIAFFGASLLFPLYFIQVRGEGTLATGWLLAPQGIGAMITMPIAGILADKIGPGKIVLVGITVITVGMAMFTQIEADTSYVYILGALFIMGLGMGGTMMPIMTAALATLTAHNVARGSTLLNITQQVAASIGTALFSVILDQRDHGQQVRPGLPGGSVSRWRPLGPHRAGGEVRTAARPVPGGARLGPGGSRRRVRHGLHRRHDPGCLLPHPGRLPAPQEGRPGRPGRDDGSLTRRRSRPRPVLALMRARAVPRVPLHLQSGRSGRSAPACRTPDGEVGLAARVRWSGCPTRGADARVALSPGRRGRGAARRTRRPRGSRSRRR